MANRELGLLKQAQQQKAGKRPGSGVILASPAFHQVQSLSPLTPVPLILRPGCRRPRFAQAGYVFHVLNRGAGRQTLFETEGDYDAFVSLLEQARQRVEMRILAFCVMPNHWHLLLWPEHDDALSEYMRWLSVTHGQRWHSRRGTSGTGPVYQGRFKSFPVQEDQHFLGVCGYVERNALRGSLCARAELWKWGSAWASRENSCPVTLSPWPLARPVNWQAYLNEPESEAELALIRHSVNHGRPYGGSDWIKHTARTLGLQRTLHGPGNAGLRG